MVEAAPAGPPATTVDVAAARQAAVHVGRYRRWPEDDRIPSGGRRLTGCSLARDELSEEEANPVISVITVCFNAASTLRECIESVLDQDYDRVEYLVIDGGSTDGSVDIIREYEHALDYWISEPDAGIYDAINKGLYLVQGDVVGILNADDMYYPGALSTAASYFRDRSIDYLFGSVQKGSRVKTGLHLDKRKYNLQFYPAHSVGAFFRVDIHRNFGVYPTRFTCSSDRYLIHRMVKDPQLVGCATNEKEILGYFRPGGFSSSRTRVQKIREEVGIRRSAGDPMPWVLGLAVYKLGKYVVFERILRPVYRRWFRKNSGKAGTG